MGCFQSDILTGYYPAVGPQRSGTDTSCCGAISRMPVSLYCSGAKNAIQSLKTGILWESFVSTSGYGRLLSERSNYWRHRHGGWNGNTIGRTRTGDWTAGRYARRSGYAGERCNLTAAGEWSFRAASAANTFTASAT